MTAGVMVEIRIAGGDWKSALGDIMTVARRAAEEAWRAAGDSAGPGSAELSLVFADDAFVAELNATYRGKSEPTNVLSFSLDAEAEPDQTRLLGDGVLAFETVRREAKRDGKSLSAHVSHLVIHGILHLLGHDHESAEEASAMEALEIGAMTELGFADPYAAIRDAA